MKNNRFTRGAVALLTAGSVLAVSACAASEPSDTDGVTIQLYAVQHTWTEGIKPLLADFESETGIKVVVTELSEAQLADQQQVKLNAQSSDIDVMMISPKRQGPQFQENGWLANLDEYVDGNSEWDWDDYQETAQSAAVIDESVYVVPVVLERMMMYYRKDLLQEAGLEVPETLEELEAAAAVLHDPANGIYGFISRGLRQAAVSTFASFYYSITGDDYIEDGTVLIDSPAAIEAYEFYGHLLRDYGPPGVLDMNWTQAVPIFQQGGAAFYHDADSIFQSFFDEGSQVADTIGFAPFPAGESGRAVPSIAAWGITVSEFSEQKDAAWEFVEWITSKDVSAELMLNMVPSPRISTWENEAALVNYPPELVELIQNPPADLEFIDHNAPEMINVGEARDILAGPLVTAIEGGDVSAAAVDAARKLQTLLDSE